VAVEIVLRMMLLKHIPNWSFQDLEREVRPNLWCREFTRGEIRPWAAARCLRSQEIARQGNGPQDRHLTPL